MRFLARRKLTLLCALLLFVTACSSPVDIAVPQGNVAATTKPAESVDVSPPVKPAEIAESVDVPPLSAPTEPVAVSQATQLDQEPPAAEAMVIEAILDATLASELIEFEADMHVSGWTSIAAEGTLVPGEDRASANTYLAELRERTQPLLTLNFVDGASTLAPVDDPSDIESGNEGLADVLFTIDSFAQGNTLREFLLDILTQVELEVLEDDVLSDSVFTRLVDVDSDDDIGVEVLVDDQFRLRRIDLSRPDLTGEDRFEQFTIFSYPELTAPATGLPVSGMPASRGPELARVVTEEMGVCARFDVIYTTRLDFRSAVGIAPDNELTDLLNAFSTANADTFNVYDIQQMMREAGQDDAFRNLQTLESVVYGHLVGGVAMHNQDMTEFEQGADRIGAWVADLCPAIPLEVLDLPNIASLLVPPTAAEIAAGQAAFCPALRSVFEARDAFRSLGGDGVPFTSEAAIAYTHFLRAFEDAATIYGEVSFVSDGPGLSFGYTSTAFLVIEIQARQALFAPVVPVDEVVLRSWDEQMEAIEGYARDECGMTVSAWQIDAPEYSSSEVATMYGDTAEASFCHSAAHELQLRIALRDQLERLEAGDDEGLVNAHALLYRLIATARGSRNDLWQAFGPDDIEYNGGWWLVSTVEWILITPLPTPETVPPVGSDYWLPFEPSHDPAPADLGAQIALINDTQPERDKALAFAADLCDFSSDLLEAGDDVALLERLWALNE